MFAVFKRLILALGLIGFGAGTALAQTPLQDSFAALQEALADEDWDAVIDATNWMRSTERWSRLPADARSEMIGIAGRARLYVGEYAGAIADLERAVDLAKDEETIGLRYTLTFAYRFNEDWALAAQTLTDLHSRDAALLNGFPISHLGAIRRGLDRSGPQEEARAFTALLGQHYEPVSTDGGPPPYPDWFRLEYARQLAGDGQFEAAFEVLDNVVSVSARLEARVDRTFEPLWSNREFDTLTDPRAGALATIARSEAEGEAYPNHVVPKSDLISTLYSFGEFEAAEEIGRETIARVDDGDVFLDLDEQMSWLINNHAYTLYQLGRTEDANAMMRRSANLVEGSSPNVSQVINLAGMYVRQQRFEEALSVLEVMADREASPYGDMWAWSLEACALHGLERSDERDTIIARMEENWLDNAAAMQQVLICSSQTERAAAHMIRRLENPQEYPGALLALQRKRPSTANRDLALGRAWEAAVDALGERDDVAAAASDVGRILEIDLHVQYWGEF